MYPILICENSIKVYLLMLKTKKGEVVKTQYKKELTTKHTKTNKEVQN